MRETWTEQRESGAERAWGARVCYKNIVCDLLEFLRQVSKFLRIASFDIIFYCFSVFFFFVLGGERHKLWAKIFIYP